MDYWQIFKVKLLCFDVYEKARTEDTAFIYLFADLQVFLSKVHCLVMVPQCSVSISKTPACTTFPNPASKTHFNTCVWLSLITGHMSMNSYSVVNGFVCAPVIEVLGYD